MWSAAQRHEDSESDCEAEWAALPTELRDSAHARQLTAALGASRKAKWGRAFGGVLDHLYELKTHSLAATVAQSDVISSVGSAFPVELTENGTGLGLLDGLSAQLRQLLSKWPRLGAANSALPLFPLEEAGDRGRFAAVAAAVLRLHFLLLKRGLLLLSRLRLSELSPAFLVRLIDALNNLNTAQADLTRHFAAFTQQESPISLGEFFRLLAEADAGILAEKMGRRLAGHLDPVAETTLADAKPEATSDYYSSSASGSRLQEETHIRPTKGRPSGELESDCGSVYTRFLEERYSVFMALLDLGSAHSNLCLEETSSGARPRSVVFLDEALKRRRRKLWRRFVLQLWEAFQRRLLGAWERGDWGLSPLGATPLTDARARIRSLETVLGAVPLPPALAPPDIGLSLARSVFVRGVVAAASSQLVAFGTGLERSSEWSGTGELIRVERALGPGDSESLGQSLRWILGTVGPQRLASLDLAAFVSIRFANLPEGPAQYCNALLTQLDDFYGRKVRNICREAIGAVTEEEKSKILTDDTIDAISDAVFCEILDPVNECAVAGPSEQHEDLVNSAVDNVVCSLAQSLVLKKFKIGPSGVVGLERLSSRLRSVSEGRRLHSLDYLDSGIGVLRDAALTRSASSFRLRRVAPAAPPPPNAALPPLAQWAKLGTRRAFIPPNCCQPFN